MTDVMPTPDDMARDLRRELYDLERRVPCHPDLLLDRLQAIAATRRALYAESECRRLRAGLKAVVAADSRCTPVYDGVAFKSTTDAGRIARAVLAGDSIVVREGAS